MLVCLPPKHCTSAALPRGSAAPGSEHMLVTYRAARR